MAAVVTGDLKTVRARERKQLDALAKKRNAVDEVVDADIATRAAALSATLGVHLGLLIARDGSLSHVIVGSKRELYIPDLGRYRLDKARLRRLRFIVFVPPGAEELLPQPIGPYHDGEQRSLQGVYADAQRTVFSPEIATDFLTDLEKLRFDVLAVVAVVESKHQGAQPDAVSVAHLVPRQADDGAGTRPIVFRHVAELRDLVLDFSDLARELEELFSSSQKELFDTGAETAVIVGVHTGRKEEAEESIAELQELARTAGVTVVDTIIQRRSKIDPKTVVGRGKVEELVLHCLDLGADLLIFDRELTPGQLRSVTNLTELRVLDRSMLILDIFAQRAVTSEGRLQVELAQLRYSLPRLTESNTGLSRLTGGIGGRGPGETKLEIGRRRARDRIQLLEKKLDKQAKQRELRRERRIARGVPVIAVVGYTNAGKSTLVNAITKSDVFVENKLFATLDTASRRMRFPNEKEVLFVDTVGFIRELPDELVQAFRATLEEVRDANVLLHLVDVSTPGAEQRIAVVDRTLNELEMSSAPRVLVLNKVDRLSKLEVGSRVHQLQGIPVSAANRSGLSELIAELQQQVLATFAGQDPGRFTEVAPWE